MADDESLLAVNAGSSSIKFALFDGSLNRLLHGELEGIGTRPHLSARDASNGTIADEVMECTDPGDVHGLVRILMGWLDGHSGTMPKAVGHRVAIGGLEHSAPVIVDEAVLARLTALVPLAPLHQPRNLELIDSIGRIHPGIRQVACFDTAFHRTLPELARLYALPEELRKAGAVRYGFHGLSYEYIAGLLPGVELKAAKGRTVVAHLGSGASMCALLASRSIETSMGFSPLSGLVMGTRPGNLDPGLMIWLARERGLRIDDVEHLLYHDAGLKGVSGLSNDVRDLLASEDERARLAIDLFIYRAAGELGRLAAALGGLDCIVFTAGIGEHAPHIRAGICERSAWLGVRLDEGANRDNASRINAEGSAVSVLVLPTNEEAMVARHTAELVGMGRRS